MGRMVWLYARSRGVLVTFALVVGTCLGFVLLSDWASASLTRQVSVVHALTALAASIIGISAWSPFGEPERSVALPLARLRSIHVGAVLATAGTLTGLAVAGWPALHSEVSLAAIALRSLAGLTGLALLLGRLIDARLSWLGPFVCAVLAGWWLFVTGEDRLWSPPWWLWNGQAACDLQSWLVASGLVGTGAGGFLRLGPRDTPGDVA